jgi:hypothetical protein
MDAETYIAVYGATLTDAEKRYIRAFGAPQFHAGPARNPSTPGISIGNAPSTYPVYGSASEADPNFPPG